MRSQVLDGFFEETVALQIFQVANVLAEEGVLSLGQADCVLQFAAHREHRRHFVLQKDRDRNEAA